MDKFIKLSVSLILSFLFVFYSVPLPSPSSENDVISAGAVNSIYVFDNNNGTTTNLITRLYEDEETGFVFSYAINPKTRRAILTEYVDSPSIDIVVPEKVGSITIESIGHDAFSLRYDLVSITLPPTIETIYQNAFLGCSALEAVYGGSNVDTVMAQAFSDCVNLKSVDLLSTVGIIKNNAFHNCRRLNNLFLNNLSQIDYEAFSNCAALKSVVIKDDDCQFNLEKVIKYDNDDANIHLSETVIRPVFYNSSDEDMNPVFTGCIYGVPDSPTQYHAEQFGMSFLPIEAAVTTAPPVTTSVHSVTTTTSTSVSITTTTLPVTAKFVPYRCKWGFYASDVNPADFTGSYQDTLFSQLSIIEKREIQEIIDLIDSNASSSVTYGMAASSVLAAYGIISPAACKLNTIPNISLIKPPVKTYTNSLINYYQMLSCTEELIQRRLNSQFYLSDTANLIELLGILNENAPAVINVNTPASGLKNLIIYDLTPLSPPITSTSGYKYEYKAKVYDCTSSKTDIEMFFDMNKLAWYISSYALSNDFSKINFVTGNINVLNKYGYSSPTQSSFKNDDYISIAKIRNISSSFSIQYSEHPSIGLWNDILDMSAVIYNVNGKDFEGLYAERTAYISKAGGKGFAVYDYKNDSSFDASFRFPDQYITVKADEMGHMSATPDGAAEVSGLRSMKSINILSNKGCSPVSTWNEITISADTDKMAAEINMENNGYIVHCGIGRTINVKTSSDTASYEVNYTAGATRLLVYEMEDGKIGFREMPTKQEKFVYGDANLDSAVTVSDAVLLMSYVSNSDKYRLSAEALDRGDVYCRGDGISNSDALSVQVYVAGAIEELPQS